LHLTVHALAATAQPWHLLLLLVSLLLAGVIVLPAGFVRVIAIGLQCAQLCYAMRLLGRSGFLG
jgi:hypothetical protein